MVSFGFPSQGNTSSRWMTGWSPMPPRTSASQACVSTSLSIAVWMNCREWRHVVRRGLIRRTAELFCTAGRSASPRVKRQWPSRSAAAGIPAKHSRSADRRSHRTRSKTEVASSALYRGRWPLTMIVPPVHLGAASDCAVCAWTGGARPVVAADLGKDDRIIAGALPYGPSPWNRRLSSTLR